MSGQAYRKIAAKLRAKAARAPSAAFAAEWEHLAKCYLRLAEQADDDRGVGSWAKIGGGSTDPDTPLENNGN